MVHITDVKKITLMEQVADDNENLGKQGKFSKKCIPRGYIPDFDWATIHEDQDQPIKPIKQEDPTEDTTTPAAPTEVEGPPSSCLRSKTKQQSTTREQGQPEHNPAQLEQQQPECNPASIKVNTVEITPKCYSLMQWNKTLLWAKRVSKHKAPVTARCTLIVTMAIYRLKCNQTNVLTVQ